MKKQEAIVGLEVVSKGIGARVEAVRAQADRLIRGLRETPPFFADAKLQVYLSNAERYIKEARQIELLDGRATAICTGFANAYSAAAGKQIDDLADAIRQTKGWIDVRFASNAFLTDVGEFGKLTYDVLTGKIAMLEQNEARLQTVQRITSYLVEKDPALKQMEDTDVRTARKRLMAELGTALEIANSGLKFEEFQAVVESALANERTRKVKMEEERKRQEAEQRRVEAANQGLFRAFQELKDWRVQCRAEAVGNPLDSETETAIRDYDATRNAPGSEAASTSLTARFSDLGNRWRDLASNHARKLLERLEQQTLFCRKVKIEIGLADARSLEDLKQIGFIKASEYEEWKRSYHQLKKDLGEKMNTHADAMQGLMEKEAEPLRNDISALQHGPLISEQQKSLAAIADSVRASLDRDEGDGFTIWQNSTNQLRRLRAELDALRDRIHDFRRDVDARADRLRREWQGLLDATAALNLEYPGFHPFAGLEPDSDPGTWLDALTAAETELAASQLLFAAHCSEEYEELRLRGEYLRKAIPRLESLRLDPALPEKSKEAAECLLRSRRQLSEAEDFCRDCLREEVASLPELLRHIEMLQAEHGSGQLETALSTLREDVIEQLDRWRSLSLPAMANPVAPLLELLSLQARRKDYEKKIYAKTQDVREKIELLSTRINELRDKALADFDEAVAPEYWEWVYACWRGAKDSQDILCSWADAVNGQLDEATNVLNKYDPHSRRVEGERFWARLMQFDSVRLNPHLDLFRKRQVEAFQKRRSAFSPHELPALEDRKWLKKIVG